MSDIEEIVNASSVFHPDTGTMHRWEERFDCPLCNGEADAPVLEEHIEDIAEVLPMPKLFSHGEMTDGD